MQDTNAIDALFFDQCARYPRLEARDLVKALYQSEFGCGHLVAETGDGLGWLLAEEADCGRAEREAEPPLVEPLGGAFCRVHLPRLRESGLSPETLFRLFVRSGSRAAGDMGVFLERLSRLEALTRSGRLPIDAERARDFFAAYREADCPATHHSEAFRRAYAPAYRVARADFCRWMPLFCGIDRLMARKARVLVAIEGDSASGKTSLAALLQSVYDCNVFHMDDFFLQPCQRTPERYAEPGGNVDRERFKAEVLDALARGEAFSYRPFDCQSMRVGAPVAVRPARLNVVEGAYSMHPALADAYDLSAFLAIDARSQASRILRRNGAEMQTRFLNEWIPMEKRYFEATRAPERCVIRLTASDGGVICE